MKHNIIKYSTLKRVLFLQYEIFRNKLYTF